jgi:demethylmenaquinone methyltransferase/2-methoxy-6-polyprenyl-1,4-benzoquinol methylase
MNTVKPNANSEQSKKEQVAGMFNAIAPRYDFLNRVLSMGLDHYWRAKLIAYFNNTHKVLDIATGTADLAIAAAKKLPKAQIIGVDISQEMLKIGQLKVAERKLDHTITLQQADAENLPFADNHFDGIMAAFGVRNFENLPKGLSEMHRVLEKNGKLAILELSEPQGFLLKPLYTFYSFMILPLLGKIFAGNREAYLYLPKSIAAFPQGMALVRYLQEAGFSQVAHTPLSFGVVTLYTAVK